jgi:hypothetical protein
MLMDSFMTLFGWFFVALFINTSLNLSIWIIPHPPVCDVASSLIIWN